MGFTKKEKTEKPETPAVRQEIRNEMIHLATSGLGLVAALAWNEFIKELVNDFIRPLVGGFSGIISLLIYALIVTLLAVLVTYNLSRFVKE